MLCSLYLHPSVALTFRKSHFIANSHSSSVPYHFGTSSPTHWAEASAFLSRSWWISQPVLDAFGLPLFLLWATPFSAFLSLSLLISNTTSGFQVQSEVSIHSPSRFSPPVPGLFALGKTNEHFLHLLINVTIQKCWAPAILCHWWFLRGKKIPPDCYYNMNRVHDHKRVEPQKCLLSTCRLWYNSPNRHLARGEKYEHWMWHDREARGERLRSWASFLRS